MQKNNDLLMDDELAAAFLDDDLETPGQLMPEPATPATKDDSLATDTDWEEQEDDFPGQLAVDMYETDDKLIVKARTAGIDKKDLDVSISESLLTISGTLSGGEEIEGTIFHMQECYWGEFTRTVVLPVPVREDEVEAVLKEGVLTITFEKVKQNQGIKIDVKEA